MASQRPATDSDRRIVRKVVAALGALSVPSLRNVQVEVDDGVIYLRGRVLTFYAKQLARHAATRYGEGAQVTDEIEVIACPNSRRRAALALTLLALATVFGCAPAEPPRLAVHPVRGKVLFQGRPAAGAWVIFHPKGGDLSSPRPRGKVNERGEFTLSTYEPNDGAPQGEYAVTIELRPVVNARGDVDVGANRLPAKYSSPGTTAVIASVQPGQTTCQFASCGR